MPNMLGAELVRAREGAVTAPDEPARCHDCGANVDGDDHSWEQCIRGLRRQLEEAQYERDLALGKGEAIRIHNDVVKERDAMHAELVAERERSDALVNALSYEGGPWPKKVGAAMQAIRDARGWDR